MSYFVNCPRCNADNSYLNLGNDCVKCSGTGRDWREDHELSDGFHNWSGLAVSELQKRGTISVENHSATHFFTYAPEIPTCSISKEVEQIREELGLKEKTEPSQIFCQHEWQAFSDNLEELCVKCGKKQILSTEMPKVTEFTYNRELHDLKKFFPNRCSACEQYEHTRSDHGNPISASDIVFCNIGGEARADTGCPNFKPDSTAECDGCWNFTKKIDGGIDRLFCDVLGSLTTKVWGGCSHHAEKEEVESPASSTSDFDILEQLEELHSHKHDLSGSEKEIDVALAKVISEQRKYDIYTGTRLENCERCKYVKQDSKFPDGSPTGLSCSSKGIFVTSNGCCDFFDR